VRDLIDRIVSDRDLGGGVVYRHSLPGREAVFRDTARPLSEPIRAALAREGIERLYSHQAEAIDAVRDGRHVMTVTPTASGKSLVYFLPTLETIAAGGGRRALYIYPYKALEQDQLQAFRRLAAGIGGDTVRAAIYDGDTPQSERRNIRAHPPDVLITNPDMLHLGILAYHSGWREFLGNLDHVVIDELHVYRGIFGAHFHHIIHRLHRICRHYGSDPKFVVCSATVANPEGLGEAIIGRPFRVVAESGSPSAPRHAPPAS
jgi:DEAD/DEAH box helicase domain-containing protein